jgi:hypothetical protein
MTVAEAMEVMATDPYEETPVKSVAERPEDKNGQKEDEDTYVDEVCGGRDFLSHSILLDSGGERVITAEENRVLVFSAATGQLIR